tara:strand:- start:420 stop:851 length:432 start_codon:yes stop_codon:yes gene_type:complete
MIIMFVRIHALFRHWERYHEYTDTYSKKICRDFGFEAGRGFTFKYEINNNQARSIGVLFFFSVIMFSFILRVAELPYEQWDGCPNGFKDNLTDFGSSIWLTVITMTTVGYGDIFPRTLFGQITAIFIALWGTFVISLLIMVTA